MMLSREQVEDHFDELLGSFSEDRIEQSVKALRAHDAEQRTHLATLTTAHQQAVEAFAGVNKDLESQRLSTYQAVEREHAAKKQLQAVEAVLKLVQDHLYLEIHAGHMPGRLTWLMEQAGAALHGTGGQ